MTVPTAHFEYWDSSDYTASGERHGIDETRICMDYSLISVTVP